MREKWWENMLAVLKCLKSWERWNRNQTNLFSSGQTGFNGHSVMVFCLNMKRDLGTQYEALPLGNECRSVRRGPWIPSGCCGPNFYTEWQNKSGPRSCPTQLKIELLMTHAQSLPRGLFGPLKDKVCHSHTAEGSFPLGCHIFISDDYWREFEASLPAVCCVWTPSTWGRVPSVPSSPKAKIGFKGMSGLSLLVTSNLDGLDPMGKFIISSKSSFWTDIPFSFGCFSKLGVLGSLKHQNQKELVLKLENIFRTNCFIINTSIILQSKC